MTAPAPITRDDIEAKLREIRGELDDTAEQAKGALLVAGAVAGVVLVGVAFWLGRRRGRKQTTIVEVRRV